MKFPFLQRIPKVFRNFYLLSGVAFLVILLFFADPNIFEQISQRKQRNDLKREKAFFEEQIVQVKKDLEGLHSDSRKLEQFAREKYKMKQPEEDLYQVIVVPEK